MTLKALLALVLALLTNDILSAAQTGESEPRYYSLFYNVRLMPLDHEARISIELKQEAAFVRAIKLSIDPERHRNFGGDGEIEKIPEGIRGCRRKMAAGYTTPFEWIIGAIIRVTIAV